ncbi:MAG: long-chain fatty acid--CoA ligase [Propionibacteriaceae bacterium]|nr:long-chain fatty acid--CoA ligase [Propionibacteriaceae bacterium]
MFLDRVSATPDVRAFTYPDEAEVWQDLSWRQTADLAEAFAAGLMRHGITLEDRVAIIAMTRIEWVIADYGIALAGGATTTVYPNTAVDDVYFILSDSDSKIVVAEDQEQVDKVLAHRDLDDQIALIVLMKGPSQGRRIIAWEDFLAEGRVWLAEHPDAIGQVVGQLTHDHLATLIYTSGTTGRPKGVRLSHGAWSYLAEAVELLDLVTADLMSYLWLPLSHSFGKSMMVFQAKYGFQTAVDGRVDKIVDNLSIVQPSFMCAVPRIFEKVRAAVLTGENSRGIKGKIAHWAFAMGYRAVPYRLAGKPLPALLAAQYKVADKLVFAKLRDKLGGNIRFMISGAAKLSPQIQKWFYAAGIIIIEGYGMTECATVDAVDHYRQPTFGSLGRPIPGLETQIADDGEILFRAPVVMQGYHKNPEATAEAIDAQGWLHTGDIGHFDDKGKLFITDRKKDLMKTSGGKYVAPTKVEAALMANIPYISQAIAVGDGHKYIAAVLVLDPVALLRWGKNHGHSNDSYAQLSQLPEIRRSLDRFVERANAHLERWETVKRYAILDHELTVESGAVTESMKIKRSKVIAMNREIVAGLFDDTAETGVVDEG